MLSPETLSHLAAMTCPGCQKPLGCWHCYPVTDPATLISQLTEHAPHCIRCAEEVTEQPYGPGTAGLAVIYKVKAAPKSPSGRLVRLEKDDPSTSFIHLFSPAEVLFNLVTTNAGSSIRPATRDEAYEWLKPALIEHGRYAQAGSDEEDEITNQLARLMKFLPKPAPAPEPTNETPQP